MVNDEIELEFDGKTVTYTEYKIITRKFIEKQVHTIEELRELWIDDSKRRKFIDMLQEMQIDINFIKETENSEDSDTFDLIANMIFEAPLITRNERAEQYIKANIDEISQNDDEIKEIILMILEKYKKGGIENINLRILLNEDMLQKNAYNILKSKLEPLNIAKLFNDIKIELYGAKIS
ncbi:type I restriction-modification enzyme R subunit C-terminal domain-containing protein [Methanobacterium oryzae]|uniref:type I restriction-modification enzyme R subunit C-terminal domain-containing protein n=1 Tax=Methanobacterium oryzae TaxID=69540 RepID=UPI003D2135B9